MLVCFFISEVIGLINLKIKELILNICLELEIDTPHNQELKTNITKRINNAQDKFVLSSGDSESDLIYYLKLLQMK